jgi:hypothetical protein
MNPQDGYAYYTPKTASECKSMKIKGVEIWL